VQPNLDAAPTAVRIQRCEYPIAVQNRGRVVLPDDPDLRSVGYIRADRCE